MSDNWSTFTTLARGDTLEWSVTIDSDDADDLNYIDPDLLFARAMVAIRAARQSVDDVAAIAVIINDFVIAGNQGFVNHTTGGGWDDDGRFFFRMTNTPPNGPSYSAASFTTGDHIDIDRPLAGVEPWAAGTNVVKILNFGPDPIDLDFVMLVTVAASAPTSTEDDVEDKPDDYDTHVNGTTRTGEGDTRWWFLKAPDGIPGTVAEATFDVTKLCPHGADAVRIGVHVHDGGTPLSGEVGSYGSVLDSYAEETLDGDGRALFTAPSSDPPEPNIVWFGGNDDYGPEVGGGDTFHDCGGWHVGNVGTG